MIETLNGLVPFVTANGAAIMPMIYEPYDHRSVGGGVRTRDGHIHIQIYGFSSFVQIYA